MDEDEIIWEFEKPYRAPTHPANEKILDSVAAKLVWRRSDCDLMIKCLDNYL